jgi:5-methylcytosine-specific restriction protein A
MPAKTKRAPRSDYARSPRVAHRAINDADYMCIIDGKHRTFVSKATRKNYVKAHHIVPMQFQDRFRRA